MVIEDTIASTASLPPDSAPAICDEPRAELKLDLVTVERLAVAAAAADTLEEFSAEGTWERLDPALAGHLRHHGAQLSGFLQRVQRLAAVKAHESELLGMRRTQRRLEIALEILQESEERVEGEGTFATGPHLATVSDLFMGDFTNAEVTEEQKVRTVERRRVRSAKKEEKKRRVRLVGLGVVAVSIIAASIGLVAISEFGRPKRVAVAPSVPLVPNRYLEDVRFFVPASSTFMLDGAAQIVVERTWANRSLADRKEDLAGLQVFLANRGIMHLALSWQGGSAIAMGGADEELRFIEEERMSMMDEAEDLRASAEELRESLED